MPEATATVVTSENLAAFNNSRLGITPPAAQEPAVVEPDEKPEAEKVETPDGGKTVKPEPADEVHEEDEHDPDKPNGKKEPNPKLQKRFSELTREREEARREALREREAREATERRLTELEAKLNPPKEVDADKKPDPKDFQDAFEYAEKLADWSAQQALKNRDKAEAEKTAKAAQEKLVKEWGTRQNALRAELPDYDDMLASSSVTVSDQIRDAILESDVGPKILYHLAANPEIAEALASKSPSAALREIGRLEAKLSEPVPKKEVKADLVKVEPPAPKISKAPEPITPLKGASVPVDNLVDSSGNFTGTYAQFKELAKAGKIR